MMHLWAVPCCVGGLGDLQQKVNVQPQTLYLVSFLIDMAANVHEQRGDLGTSWDQDSNKPWFHVMPRTGWLNDPNGPIYYKGRYHM